MNDKLYPGDPVQVIGVEPGATTAILGSVCQVIDGPFRAFNIGTETWADNVYKVDLKIDPDDYKPKGDEHVAFRREHLKKLDDGYDGREKTTWDEDLFMPSDPIKILETV